MSSDQTPLHVVDQAMEVNNQIDPVIYMADFNYSLLSETNATVVASRVYEIMKAPVDWDMAHHQTSYLDIVKVKYITFQIEYPVNQDECKLPSMFTQEFGFEVYKYNKLVDRYGNQFEVIVEKRDGHLYFTHGWSEIRNSYVDVEGKGMWVSMTYIRPKLFVLVLKDRYYRDLIVKHLYPPVSFNLSRTLFGCDKNPGWAQKMPLPYYHENVNFKHSFAIILSISDVTTGFLAINYGSIVSMILSPDSECVRLIDDNGLEWNCTIEYKSQPYKHLKIGGKWMSMVRARNYQEGNHVMFGSPCAGNAFELFVKKI